MQGKDNERNDLLASADLRTKKRREGEAIQAFEKIIDRSVPSPRAAKIRKPKYDRLRPHEEVLWEAPP
jgi:ribosomal protein L40E